MEQIDGFGDGVLDHHASCIAIDKLASRGRGLVGQQQGRVVVSEITHGELADLVRISTDAHRLVQDPRCSVSPSNIVSRTRTPLAVLSFGDSGEQPAGSLAQGQEVDPHPVQFGEVGMGGQAAIEDEFAWEAAVPVLPEFDEAEDFVVLVGLADGSVGVAEHPGIGVPGQKGENALLAPASLRDVVLFDQGRVAVVGNGVEVEVEGPVATEVDVEAAYGRVPAVHETGAQARIDAA